MNNQLEQIKAEIESLKNCSSPIVICDTLLSFIESLPKRDSFLALEDAVDDYISPNNKNYKDLYIDRISYETKHIIKLKIEKYE